MGEPLLTIAVACYDVESFVARAISSYSDGRLCDRVQVVLVDDGSHDATPALLDEAAVAWPRIFTVVHKENGGHGSAVNAALAVARGRYFRVVDGDDWVSTDELVRLLDVLGHADCDLIVDEKVEVDLSTMAETEHRLPEDVPFGETLPFSYVMDRPDLWHMVMIHTLTMKTELLRASGVSLLEHTFYVDLELVVKATLAASDIRFENLLVYRYLVGNASQSVADAGYVRHFDDHTRVCKELLSLLDTDDLDDARHAYLVGRCALAVNTHYNIALIFDDDRKRGLRRAREFKAWLRDCYPEVAKRTQKRYLADLLLHHLGVKSQDSLNKLMGRM